MWQLISRSATAFCQHVLPASSGSLSWVCVPIISVFQRLELLLAVSISPLTINTTDGCARLAPYPALTKIPGYCYKQHGWTWQKLQVSAPGVRFSSLSVGDSDSEPLKIRLTTMDTKDRNDSSSLEKQSFSAHDEEKKPDVVRVNVLEVGEGDEALKLVGALRTEEFSEEFNLKLRRKLVSKATSWSLWPNDQIVHLPGFCHSPNLRGSILHPVSVSDSLSKD